MTNVKTEAAPSSLGLDLYDRLFARFALARRLRAIIWYRLVSKMAVDKRVTFMNYGYEPLNGDLLLVLEEGDEPNRSSIQLYHFLASQTPLNGKTVLEVGCGRGGGASFVMRYHLPKQLVGIDLNPRNVEFCEREHGRPGLSFERGDAEQLQFNDATFDVVINVESSHCYGDVKQFFSEVKRVLKPGGFFLFTDFRNRNVLSLLDQQVDSSGFTKIHEREITKEIVNALEKNSEARLRQVLNATPRIVRSLGRNFAGVKGSTTYDSFASGYLVYKEYVLQKPLN